MKKWRWDKVHKLALRRDPDARRKFKEEKSFSWLDMRNASHKPHVAPAKKSRITLAKVSLQK
jgi:hypothetical protein